tara:strand:- start:828 stop:1109 length:282 start_codon:yes stop_codon:yes gene_type:complete
VKVASSEEKVYLTTTCIPVFTILGVGASMTSPRMETLFYASAAGAAADALNCISARPKLTTVDPTIETAKKRRGILAAGGTVLGLLGVFALIF